VSPLHRRLLTTLLLLACLSAAGGFVLYSETLLGWGFTLLQKSLPGELSAEAVAGRIAGPIHIRGLRYQDKVRKLSLDELRFDWQPGALLYNTLRISTLQLRGLTVDTTTTTTEENTVAPTLPQLWLPLALTVEDLRLQQLKIGRAGSKPLTIDLVTLAASVYWHTLTLQQLRVESRELGLQGRVAGSLELRDDYPLTMQLQGAWQPASGNPFVAAGRLTGDLTALQLQQRLSSPVVAQLDATLQSLLSAPQWQAKLSLPTLDSEQLAPFMTSTAPPFALRETSIDARGDLHSLRFEAASLATLEATGEVAVQLGGMVDATALELERLQLVIPGSPGEFNAHGQLAFADLSYLAHGAWSEVGWPLIGERRVTSAQGTLTVTGEGTAYRLSLDADLHTSGLAGSRWRVAASGDTQGLHLEGVHVALLDGTLEGTARLAWSPQLEWEGRFEATGLNPAALGPAGSGWPGAIDLGGEYHGSLGEGKLANLLMEGRLTTLGGTLRERPLKGHAKGEWRNAAVHLDDVQASWGSARVKLAGRAGTLLDLKGDVTVGELGELLPQGAGSLQGTWHVSGAHAAPLLQLSLNGKGLGWQTYRTTQSMLKGTVDLDDATPSSLDLRLDGLQQGEQPLGVFSLRGNGRLSKHKLELSLRDGSQPQHAATMLVGGYSAQRWQGHLERMVLRPYGESTWQQVTPAPLELSLQQSRLAALCLQEQAAQLCLEGEWQNTAGLQTKITAQGLPLRHIEPLLPPRLAAMGDISGSATLQHNPGERLTLDGDFALREGRLTLFEADGKTVQRLLPLQVTTLHLATAADGALGAEARVSFSEQDHLNASLQLPLQQGWLRPAAAQPLQARLELQLQDLTLLELLQPEIHDPQGQLRFTLRVGGTLARPEPAGRLQLSGGSCTVPRLGLRLDGLTLKAESVDGDRLTLSAAARSGGGVLNATGAVMREGDKGWALNLQLDGDNFEVARIPEARLKLSPQLKIHVEPLLVRVDGRLTIPEARLEPRDIGRAVTVSQDVVIVDAPSASLEERWRIYTNVEVEAADTIRFIGYGFDGRIGGRLLLNDEPQRLTRGRGELHVVAGSSYTAFGQKLQTPRGRLIFADSPVDNPNLDIVAQREVGDVVAGVRVGGTARNPILTLFSQPSMDEVDILAYLTLGHPLAGAGQSDGQTMMKAANTAGLAGGDYIASYLGRQFGLEEARLESERETEQPWLMIGKYLSPRLYIRYGTALLESGNSVLVRYQLSDNWFLEGESGRNSGGDLIYTFERP
jgi:translocation and assembly module TamB